MTGPSRSGDDRAKPAGTAGARATLGVAVPAIILAVGVGAVLLWGGSVPDPVAGHFDLSGNADDSVSLTGFLTISGIGLAVGVVGCILAAVRAPRWTPPTVAALAGLTAFIGALMAAVIADTLWSQRDLDRWQDASLPPWHLAVLLGFAAGVAALASHAGLRAGTPEDPDTGRPLEHDAAGPVALRPGERLVWTRTLTARWPTLAGIGAAVGALVVGLATGAWLVSMVMAVTAIPALALGSIRVRIDRSGVTVRYRLAPFVRTHVPLRRIADARAVRVRPSEWGGWGYRGSLKLMRRAAVVLRAGPGLRLDLVDGSAFAVTIDDADGAAAALHGLLASVETSAGTSAPGPTTGL